LAVTRRRVRSFWLVLLLVGVAHAEPEPVGAPSPEQAPAPTPPAEDVPLTPPVLVGEAAIDYPPGAHGSALVVLHLTIEKDGTVSDARAVSGPEPFASAAAAAALRFEFEPARRGSEAVSAKIRFEVRFSEPPPIEPGIPSLPAGAPAPSTPAADPDEPLEVLVIGERQEPTTRTLTRAEVRQLPGAFGDPFRAIEALPGVTPIVSGVPFFYVRGAPPGNVGYFLDSIRVPLLYHVGLGPSVVHPGMVGRVDLYPGAYPAHYGRFGGGIVAGETSEPSPELRGEWQVRLFDSGAMLEFPFADGRGQLLVGGRYSYTAFVISLFAEDVRLEYWDYQLRAGYKLSPHDTLSVFTFGSFDYFGEDTGSDDDAFLSTEFHRIDLRYDRRIGSDSQWRTALTLGIDRSRNGDSDGAVIDQRAALRNEYEQQLTPTLRLRAGADVNLDYYSVDIPEEDESDFGGDPAFDTPGMPAEFPQTPNTPTPNGQFPSPPPGSEEGDPDDDSDEAELRRAFPTRRDFVAGAYVDAVWQVTRGVTLTPGLRVDVYNSDGATAIGVDPRISAAFRVGRNWTLKHAFGIAHQPPSFVIPIPGFELGGLRGGLQQSLQASAGVEYRLPDEMTLSLTGFHNVFFKLSDILSLVRAEQVLDDDELDIDSRTRGQAYGLEFMFHRDLTRRLGGFLSYTLSRSERYTSIGRIPSAFDRTHVLSAALGYDLGANWRAGGRFVFYSGTPGNYDLIDTAVATVLGRPYREPPRLAPFYRLDVRLEKRWLIGNGGAFWSFVFEVLNTTLNKETVSSECDERGCDEERIGPVTVPSIGVEGGF
jgi:hypothetical protein